MEQSDSSKRVVISAKVSPDSAEGWKSFCHRNGVSLSAMLEVAGRALLAETFPPKVEERQRMVEEARKVDIERRARN